MKRGSMPTYSSSTRREKDAMKPKKVVYVSCNPATLARDLLILEDGGYKTAEIQPVGMFPQTMHVECVALIELK
jgi:23S rRNA (uracil1939-C5)-methyltransferase